MLQMGGPGFSFVPSLFCLDRPNNLPKAEVPLALGFSDDMSPRTRQFQRVQESADIQKKGQGKGVWR